MRPPNDSTDGLAVRNERASSLRAPVAALALALALAGVWLATGSSPRSADATNAGPGTVGGALTHRPRAAIDPEPFLADAERRNAAAVDRALADLQERFDGFRAGAPAFAQDMASWGTRLRILGRGGADWWIGLTSGAPELSDRVRTFVGEKLQRHVLAPGALEDAVADAVATFALELESSQNGLWIEVSSRLRPSDGAPGAVPLDSARARDRAAALASAMTASHAQRTIGAGLAALGVSTAGSIVAEQVAAASLARVGASLAAGAGAEALGAGATGAAGASVGAGASGGALAGPAGVIIGVGVGLVAGVAIDWWMTERFEARLTEEVRAYLDRVEHELIEGSTGERAGGGLRVALLEAARAANQRQRAAVLAAISEEQP